MGRGRGGRGRGNRGGRGGGRGRGGGSRDNRYDDRRGDAYQREVTRENSMFKQSYRGIQFKDEHDQTIDCRLLPEDEFEQMWKSLQTDLPNSFRFTGAKTEALAARDTMEQRYAPEIQRIDFEGEPVEPPKAVECFPNRLVWSMTTSKRIVRRYKPFAAFQKFLVSETSFGNISRQEVVSMIPPFMLDVKPGMVVLDMCAAPGSKTAQLAEMIHGDEEDRVQQIVDGKTSAEGDYSDDGRSTGLLIANDTDYKRAHMLVHQIKRLNFPNIIVTQHDAAIYPSIALPDPSPKTKQYLKFDRILADVPCSGDGTARKNIETWKKWTPKDGIGLHNLQLRILTRGLQMLKVGGRIVYSTCSMNPVENESVVAAAIECAGGVDKVQLVDCSAILPDLKRKPGLNTWCVWDTPDGKTLECMSSYEKYLSIKDNLDKSKPDHKLSSRISRSMFPPGIQDESQRPFLERAIRIYPHLQDTGGFFVAVLEKKAEIKSIVSQSNDAPNEIYERRQLPSANGKASQNGASEEKKDTSATDGTATSETKTEETTTAPKRALEEDSEPAATKRTRYDGPSKDEDDVVQDAADNEVADQSLPPSEAPNGSAKPETTMTTTDGVRRNQKSGNRQDEYFEYLPEDDEDIDQIFKFFGVSDRFPRSRFMVKNKEGKKANKIYYTSELAKHVIQANIDRGVRFVQCGVAMFVGHNIKATPTCPWRLQMEGIKIIAPWISKRVVVCTSKKTLYSMLIEMYPKANEEGLKELGEIGQQLKDHDLETGGCVLKVTPTEDKEDGFEYPMILPFWRHPGSVNLMVPNDDRKALLLRLYDEENPVITNHVAKAIDEERANGGASKAEEAAIAEVEGDEDDDTKEDKEAAAAELAAEQGDVAVEANGA